MRINADFSKPAVVVPADEDWVRSPESGVDRLMLDRIGDEVARATSLVRYAAGSSFAKHVHARGEEFLVLDGIFSDESGDFPAGTYVRNPPGTSHAPHSDKGCRILVKLRQFEVDDLEPVVIDTTNYADWSPVSPTETRLDLHEFRNEKVEMRRYAAGASFDFESAGGAELLVISGAIDYRGTRLAPECWLRLPEGDPTVLTATEESQVWAKTGHLRAATDENDWL